MKLYHDNPNHRIGDEIQLTAVFKYFVSNGYEIHHKDSNTSISAMSIFPDNIVVFSPGNIHNLPIFDPLSLWFWSVFLKQRRIYTEVKNKYDLSKADIDVVFIPVLEPAYNEIRAIRKDCVLSIFHLLNHDFKNIKMIIDKNKKKFINIEHPNIIYSENIHETFKYIERSKVFIGSDTGTSHYAGALNHPKMILLYPNESSSQEQIRWHRYILADTFHEQDFTKIEASSLPCCNPNNYKVLELDKNNISITKLYNIIKNYGI